MGNSKLSDIIMSGAEQNLQITGLCWNGRKWSWLPPRAILPVVFLAVFGGAVARQCRRRTRVKFQFFSRVLSGLPAGNKGQMIAKEPQALLPKPFVHRPAGGAWVFVAGRRMIYWRSPRETRLDGVSFASARKLCGCGGCVAISRQFLELSFALSELLPFALQS